MALSSASRKHLRLEDDVVAADLGSNLLGLLSVVCDITMRYSNPVTVEELSRAVFVDAEVSALLESCLSKGSGLSSVSILLPLFGDSKLTVALFSAEANCLLRASLNIVCMCRVYIEGNDGAAVRLACFLCQAGSSRNSTELGPACEIIQTYGCKIYLVLVQHHPGMSTFRDSPMGGAVNDADVVMNRLNVALARSQRLINSWLPQNQTRESEDGEVEADDDDEHFKPMSETGGIGSKVAFDDEGLPDGAWQRKKLSSNEKLMEQLMGKKAARARVKSRDAGKSISASRHAAPKPLLNAMREQKRKAESEDEDEGGRAAAFKPRKRGKAREHQVAKQIADQGNDGEMENDESGPVRGGVADEAHDQGTGSIMDSEPGEKASKRMGGSYLDELLAQKAKKKKARNKKNTPSTDS